MRAKPDIVTLLRGKRAQRSDMAALCIEAAEEIVLLRHRYSIMRRVNSIVLREVVSARQKDDALGPDGIAEWAPLITEIEAGV